MNDTLLIHVQQKYLTDLRLCNVDLHAFVIFVYKLLMNANYQCANEF